MQARIAINADTNLAISPTVYRSLAQLGVPKEKIAIIPNQVGGEMSGKKRVEEGMTHRRKYLEDNQFGVLAVYGKILPQALLDVFLKGIVNIHPSLLPKYRGPAPAPFVIKNGETVSGIAIMLLAAAMDAGPVLKMATFEVSPSETPATYYEKGFALGTQLLIDVLPAYLEDTITPVAQDDTQATYTHMLSREDGKIDWGLSSGEIERMVRAFTPWPGTWTEVWEDTNGKLYLDELMRERLGLPVDHTTWPSVKGKRLKVLEASLEMDTLVLNKVQIEGETAISFSKLLARIS
jgi:methionyl-tRNA formyltransferase